MYFIIRKQFEIYRGTPNVFIKVDQHYKLFGIVPMQWNNLKSKTEKMVLILAENRENGLFLAHFKLFNSVVTRT